MRTGSRAADYCRRLRTAAMAGLTVAAVGSDSGLPYPVGWGTAPWGIDHVTQAAATVPVCAGGAR